MTHVEALEFLQPAQVNAGETWADLGAGTGTFSRALAEFVGTGGTVHAVDKDKQALSQITLMNPTIITHQQDFMKPLELKNLDGILIANALHFVRQQEKVLKEVSGHLNRNGKLVIIEYDISRANLWVPFPVSFGRLKDLAAKANLGQPVKVTTRASSYHREMYLAVMTLKNSP